MSCHQALTQGRKVSEVASHALTRAVRVRAQTAKAEEWRTAHYGAPYIWHRLCTPGVRRQELFRIYHGFIEETLCSTVPKFRIDVNVHSLFMNSASEGPELPVDRGMTLPEPVYPRFPEKLSDHGPETPRDHRDWTLPYQMVNEVQRLEEIKAFMRMGGNASDLKTLGRNGDGNTTNGTAKHIACMPGIEQNASGDLHLAEWNCRADRTT